MIRCEVFWSALKRHWAGLGGLGFVGAIVIVFWECFEIRWIPMDVMDCVISTMTYQIFFYRATLMK